MEKNKAPRPDVFPTEFYQRFWDTIKHDMMEMFVSFQKGELPLFHLNYGIIIFLSK
jgi:hypothetical protein